MRKIIFAQQEYLWHVDEIILLKKILKTEWKVCEIEFFDVRLLQCGKNRVNFINSIFST